MLREKVDVRDRSARRDWLGKEEVSAVPEPAAWKTVEKDHQVAKAHFDSASVGALCVPEAWRVGSADNALPAV
jgi:hypothetical protein